MLASWNGMDSSVTSRKEPITLCATISGFGFPDDVAFTKHLIGDIGVACVPGSSFFSEPARGKHIVRFCFCKKEETLLEAGARLRNLAIH